MPGRCSFGIYLAHVFFTVALREVILRLELPHNAWVYLIDMLVAWLLALGVTYLAVRLRKVRALSWLGWLFP